MGDITAHHTRALGQRADAPEERQGQRVCREGDVLTHNDLVFLLDTVTDNHTSSFTLTVRHFYMSLK